ncbi:hypothetical protein [Pseudomonas sp. Marseille-Q0931]|uniref:hypothetical protein n=1 Tax=Pseudomonas sp. Marseille-Q0931 TaxID=2697507 RepID=UPI0023B91D9B|nr:hypothetical protein [Pseudomonas sp. Marseille-Q0931]
MSIPFYERQLSSHLNIQNGRVFFVAVEGGGFCLVVWDGRNRYVLNTQRDQVRTFMDLTRAAAYIHEAGVTRFMVCMSDSALIAEIKPSATLRERSSDEELDDAFDRFDGGLKRPSTMLRPKRPRSSEG